MFLISNKRGRGVGCPAAFPALLLPLFDLFFFPPSLSRSGSVILFQTLRLFQKALNMSAIPGAMKHREPLTEYAEHIKATQRAQSLPRCWPMHPVSFCKYPHSQSHTLVSCCALKSAHSLQSYLFSILISSYIETKARSEVTSRRFCFVVSEKVAFTQQYFENENDEFMLGH